MKDPDKSLEKVVFPLYLISGYTLQNGIPITIAYLGPDQLKLAQWTSLIMNSPSRHHIGDYPIGGLIGFLKKQHPACSLVLVEKDLPGEIEDNTGNGFSLPYFMQMYINISEPIEKLIEKSRSGFNNTRRLIAKYNLSYELTTAPEARLDFYRNMYLPYLRQRHGETFQQVAFHNVFSKEIPFEIIHIKAGDEVFAGGVFRIKNNQFYFSFLGVKDGLFENVHKGALSAAYYFLCDELYKRGYQKLYLGGSPPFINHPLTKYKSRMTAQVDNDYHYSDKELVSLFLLNDSAALRDFLSNSPFVFVNGEGKSIGAVWFDNHKSSNIEELKKEVNRVFRLGLDECQIIYWGKKPKLTTGMDAFENKTIRFGKAQKYFDSKWIANFRKIEMKTACFCKLNFCSFDEAGYLAANPDVEQAISIGQFRSGKQHYRKFGKREGRNKYPNLSSR